MRAQGGRSWAQGGRLTSLSVYESNLVIEICRERAGDRTRTRSVGTQDTHRTIDHDHHTRTVRTRKEVPHFGPPPPSLRIITLTCPRAPARVVARRDRDEPMDRPMARCFRSNGASVDPSPPLPSPSVAYRLHPGGEALAELLDCIVCRNLKPTDGIVDRVGSSRGRA